MSMFSFHRHSLRRKLIVTTIACLLLPTIIMLYITSTFSQRIIREQTLDNAIQSLKMIQYQLYGIMDEMVSVSNRIQFDSELGSLLQIKDDPLASRNITEKLEQWARDRPDMNLTLLLADGRYYSNYSYDEFNPSLFREQAWFRALPQSPDFETYYLGAIPHYLKSKVQEDPYVLLTARTLMDYYSKPYASLLVSRGENTISNIFAHIAEEIFLLDESGRILSHRNKEVIGQSFHSLVPIGQVESPAIIQLNGEQQLYVSLPLRFGGWRLVSLAPYEQLTDKVNRIHQSGLMLQVMFAACFIFILAYLIRKFTMPIKVLGKVAAEVESGDMEVRSKVRGGDEVGRLGRSFDNMLDRIQQTLEQVKVEQELKRQAELAMLQAQIHPHFLFNVLSAIRLNLLMKDDEKNAELVGSLSSLLRATISSRQEFVSLYSEVEMSEKYADLMNLTMRHPVKVEMDVEPELLASTVPRLILQPIIENAYKHAFSRKGGTLQIQVEQAGDSLRITIEDNGAGMDKETRQLLHERLRLNKQQIIEEGKPPSGIGLSNVYERLKIMYGNRFQMAIQSEAQEGTRITLMIPTSTMENNGYV
ncbi:sensor histidine kinase [Paenibacillus puerhi]|uniref:sensor histidine kinase n=1 Tax=Paenibacillus puerhi TaxID=2692622 RepID=UPI0013596B22|nr:sensor histidine kinase [Paenibacillus puerhi]